MRIHNKNRLPPIDPACTTISINVIACNTMGQVCIAFYNYGLSEWTCRSFGKFHFNEDFVWIYIPKTRMMSALSKSVDMGGALDLRHNSTDSIQSKIKQCEEQIKKLEQELKELQCQE